MNDKLWSLSAKRVISYFLLWHPFRRRQLLQFVNIADDASISRITLHATRLSGCYGLGIGFVGGSLMSYGTGLFSLPMAILALLSGGVLLIVSSRGLAKLKKDIETIITPKTHLARELDKPFKIRKPEEM